MTIGRRLRVPLVLPLLTGAVLGTGTSDARWIVQSAGPGHLHISDLHVAPAKTIEGCPVAISFQLHDPKGEVGRAVVRWELRWQAWRTDGSQAMVVPAEAPSPTSRAVTVEVRPKRRGTYRYHVHVENESGTIMSNMLSGEVAVGLRVLFETRPCS
jgi:hypothetical protein